MIKILGSLIIKRRRNKCGFMKTEVDSNSELKFEILDEFRNYGAVLLLLQQPRLMGNVVFRSSLHAKLTWWRTLNADSVISLNENNNKQRDEGRCCAAAEDYGSCCLSPFLMKTCLIMLQSFICVATGVTVLVFWTENRLKSSKTAKDPLLICSGKNSHSGQIWETKLFYNKLMFSLFLLIVVFFCWTLNSLFYIIYLLEGQIRINLSRCCKIPLFFSKNCGFFSHQKTKQNKTKTS